MDEAKAKAFAARTLEILNDGALALMMSVGHRTRLFDEMAMLPPSTSTEIATAAGLQERYVREWLGAMVVGRVVDYVPEDSTYYLAPEHAAALTRAASTGNVANFAQLIPLVSAVEDEIVQCFHHGGGVPYSSFTRFPEVMRENSAPRFDTVLVDRVLPMITGLPTRLEQGIDVLDVGCGCGRATNVMARAYPKSRFIGYDFLESQIATADSEARDWRLDNVRFELRDIARLDAEAQYDLVTAFDVVHDQAHPDLLLEQIAIALKSGGIFLMIDIAASSDVHENIDHVLGPLLYTISCMHCMSVSLAQGAPGSGRSGVNRKHGKCWRRRVSRYSWCSHCRTIAPTRSMSLRARPRVTRVADSESGTNARWSRSKQPRIQPLPDASQSRPDRRSP